VAVPRLYVQVRFRVEILDGPSALADQCESVLSVSSVVRFSGSTPNTRSLQPTRALMSTRARLTAVGITNLFLIGKHKRPHHF
jgi:hypothetical protein